METRASRKKKRAEKPQATKKATAEKEGTTMETRASRKKKRAEKPQAMEALEMADKALADNKRLRKENDRFVKLLKKSVAQSKTLIEENQKLFELLEKNEATKKATATKKARGEMGYNPDEDEPPAWYVKQKAKKPTGNLLSDFVLDELTDLNDFVKQLQREIQELRTKVERLEANVDAYVE